MTKQVDKKVTSSQPQVNDSKKYSGGPVSPSVEGSQKTRQPPVDRTLKIYSSKKIPTIRVRCKEGKHRICYQQKRFRPGYSRPGRIVAIAFCNEFVTEMTFQSGKSGNPRGKKPGTKNKRLALLQSNDVKQLQRKVSRRWRLSGDIGALEDHCGSIVATIASASRIRGN